MMKWVYLAALIIFFSAELEASTNLKEFFERCLPDCIHPRDDAAPPLLDNADAQGAIEDNPVNPCVVCTDRPSNTYSTACGHLATCKGCADSIKRSTNSNCPMCRKEMTTLRTVMVSAACALCNTVAPNTMNEACSHVCMCNGCVDENIAQLERCPVCDEPITRYIELYRADASF